jgi:hypothetical protein
LSNKNKMKSADLVTLIVVIAVLAGGWYLVEKHRNAAAEAGYYQSRPTYLDNDPSSMAADWTGWNAKVDVFIHHKTNRPACDAIEYGWLAWHDHVPVVVHTSETGSKHLLIRTDNLEDPNDFVRVPSIELPYDRGVNVEVSNRMQRNQYLVNWAHRYGFRFVRNIPTEWHDYYTELKNAPGQVIVVPASGHSMKECRTAQETRECEKSPSSLRCEDDRYSKTAPFLYPDWANDTDANSVISYVKSTKHTPPPSSDTSD